MAILDQYGQPIRLPDAALNGPTVVGSRPAIMQVPIDGLDPALLGSLLADAAQGNSLGWQCACEEIEQKDLHYLGVLSTRKRTVAQLPITVSPAGSDPEQKKQAEFVRTWVETGVLRHALFDMLDAIGKGFSVSAIEWNRAAADYWPRKLIFRPQRWFDVSWQDGETIRMRDDAGDSFTPGIPGAVAETGFTSIPEKSSAIHRHPSWSGLTLQAGLTRAVAWFSMFKFFTVRDWGIFVQNFGMPIRIGRFGPDATSDDRDTLWRALTDIGGALSAMIPKGMEFDFVEPKNGAGANDLHERRVKWIDEQISKAVLGQTGTTDTRSGTHASGVIHRQVQEDIERWDAGLLSHTVNDQIVRWMVDMTFGVPAGGKYPVIAIGRPDEPPLSELISGIQWLGPQGWKVRSQDMYDRFGLTPPEDGDEVIGITAQAQPAAAPHVLPSEQRPTRAAPGQSDPPDPRTPQAGQQDIQTVGKNGNVDQHVILGRLLEKHAQQQPGIVELMTQQLASRAADALAGMTAEVRREFEAASSMEDLEARLDRLNLDDEAFAQAMTQGMLIAELAGEASALEAMGG
ncbi:MAG: DUF935 family protein [Acetobacter sp.]|nr:DUF935 family protein [Acetobacter sp.]